MALKTSFMNDKPRAVMFYRATRPQAPWYAKLEANRNDIECSICRGLFLPDTKEARSEHRKWHAEHGDERIPCGLSSDTRYGRGEYRMCYTCHDCSEDVCPCDICQDMHRRECARFQEANELFATGNADDEAMGDVIIEAMLASRLPRRECAWCNTVLFVGESGAPTTHTICSACEVKVHAEIEETV